MNESCANCGRQYQPNPKLFEKHYLCPAVERGDFTADALWSKIQTHGKPYQCQEWCDKNEIGDDSK